MIAVSHGSSFMSPHPTSTPEGTLPSVAAQIQALLGDLQHAPTTTQIENIFDVLYAASLLREEGRAVRARVVIAPPEAYLKPDDTSDGFHALRFSTQLHLSAHEIKRLSPAASFFHSAVGVWPDAEGRLRIWGIINTGPNWMNLVAGGRKPLGEDMPYPVIHVRDPGWLLFYFGYSLISEWRGREFHGPRLDVFQSKILTERFGHIRRSFVEDLPEGCLPATLTTEVYADVAHLIAIQFVKRIINLVRTSGHGGSLVIVPEGEDGMDAAARWIDCKYTADTRSLRFRNLLKLILCRIGELSPQGSTLLQAWEIFRSSRDSELDFLEASFFELARFLSDLMQVDGALVVDEKFRVIGFGGEIRVDRTVLQVSHASDPSARSMVPWNVQNDGTRHRSVYRLCSVEPTVLGFVISQDSQVRLIANLDDAVVFWTHTVI